VSLHIWYIHSSAGGPGLGIYHRPYHLARAWEQQGHTSTIYTASFHHLLEAQVVPAPELQIEGVRYVTIPSRNYTGNGLGRILNMWDFSSRLYGAGQKYGKNEIKPDALIVSSPHPFSIFAGRALSRRYSAKLIFEFRDIWPLSLTEILGISSFHPFVQMCAYTERFALAEADLIASALPRADHYLSERGFGHKPFVWVPNGLEIASTHSSSIESDAGRAAAAKVAQWKAQGKVIIIYTGSIGTPNGIDLLLEALRYGKTIGESDRCATLIVGKGEKLEELHQFSAREQLPNVHFSGRIPKSDAIALLKGADIGYAGLKNIEALFGYGISPNKIADYFSASLPVLLPIAPCGDPVSESGGGIARGAGTPDVVWGALQELVRLSPQERRALGARGKAYMIQEYDYNNIAGRYIDAINQLPSVID